MAETSKNEGEKENLQLRRATYKGIAMFECEIDDIEKMDTRDDDIWVCSFPRSGTTLVQELTYLVQTLDFETARSVQLDARFPQLEQKDDRFPYYKGVKYVEEMKSPRMIKCHLHHFMLPVQLQKGKGRIIYIVRNPKDIATSFYRLLQWGGFVLENDIAFEVFVDEFVNGTGLFCPWPRHVLEFWERRIDKNVLFLKYEDVVKDKPKTARQIAEFLGRTLTEDDVAKICDYCSVDNMKNNPMCNMSYWRDIKKVYDGDGGFINQGKAGAWKSLLTPEMAKKIEKLLDEIKGSGLNLDDE
ncbi:sulfotransferase 4A1-like [Mercenaria mercenaria]|uniref:sulfotransferase 4A1-like n=1 Tax=Mercenaria mercenaria TaxID=6596 RepID=UPI00234E4681|nr:sulfotransferase 4A1-like [Mercenaria mercenaria]XP_045164646.2 sulfotransferase 4A1-like [Mercenaria mercenaria]